MGDADPGTAALAGLIELLRALPPGADDPVRIDRIRLLEELKAAAAAVQLAETAAFAAGQRAAQRAAGVAPTRVGRGIAGQLALARRISPHQAGRYLGWAAILTSELPHTLAALRAGQASEWRAVLVARETSWLSREHRLAVDAELGPQLAGLGDRQVEAEAKKLAYRLDPAGAVARTRQAEADRHVAIRPAPDTMVRLSALLPVAHGVACYAALSRAADTHIAAGDQRGRGQVMADTLVERLTGQPAAADVPLAVNLIITDQTLLDPAGPGGDEPAQLDGYGPLPAPLARELITRPADAIPMWLRRLYTHPHTGQLAAMDSNQRCFTPAQRHFIRLRDQRCRTPYCGAPIRHTDHIHPAEQHGATAVDNGQGYCQACNHTKQAPGWRTVRINNDDGPHQVDTTTPTGHHYRSRAPDPPRRKTA